MNGRRSRVWLGLGLVLAVTAFLLVRLGAEGDDEDAPFRGDEVLIGNSRIAVDRLLGDDVFLAAEGPAPEIETAGLGVEQPIDRTPVVPPRRFGRPAVLVGSNAAVDAIGHGGGSLFYYEEDAGLGNRFFALFGMGQPAMECYGSDAGGGCVGGAALMDGPPSLASLTADDPATPVVIEWLPLPPDTSLVVVRGANGNPLWWQRPAGRLAYLAIPMAVGTTVELEALDTHGQKLASESFTRCDFSDPRGPAQC